MRVCAAAERVGVRAGMGVGSHVGMRVALRMAVCTIALAAPAAHAQSVGAGAALPPFAGHGFIALGATSLPMAAWSGGSIGTIALTAGVGRRIASRHSAQLRLRWLAPTSSVAAIPGCVPGASCQTLSSPDRLATLSLHVARHSATNRVQVSVGAGVLDATGVQPGPRRTAVADAGLAWRALSGRRTALTLGLHGVLLQRRVAGMRAFVLPTIGIAF